MKANEILFVARREDNPDFDENKPKETKPFTLIDLQDDSFQFDFVDGGYLRKNELDLREWNIQIITIKL